MIRALIFDFDGLILETEEPVFQSYQEIYQEYGVELSLDYWSHLLGAASGTHDPLADLENQLGLTLPRQEILQRQHQRETEMILVRPVMPGVRETLQRARQLGLKIGLASSSPCSWVIGHLTRLGLVEYFDCIKASDDVERAKPDPSLFLAVLEELGISSKEAIVFEDSPNGILAAKRAGLFCVVVPNVLTRKMPIDHADLCLDSLKAITLDELLVRIQTLMSN